MVDMPDAAISQTSRSGRGTYHVRTVILLCDKVVSLLLASLLVCIFEL